MAYTALLRIFLKFRDRYQIKLLDKNQAKGYFFDIMMNRKKTERQIEMERVRIINGLYPTPYDRLVAKRKSTNHHKGKVPSDASKIRKRELIKAARARAVSLGREFFCAQVYCMNCKRILKRRTDTGGCSICGK